MGAAAILVLLITSTVYAHNQTRAMKNFTRVRAFSEKSTQTGFGEEYMTAKSPPIYLPKSPRRPIIMVWPSVMKPEVAQAFAELMKRNEDKDEYLKIMCDKKSHTVVKPFALSEVTLAIHRFDEELRAPRFWRTLVPELIQWLSTEAIECGFTTIYPYERPQIYRFINANRPKWIRAVQELVYILLQVIAVIHYKANAYGPEISYRNVNWLERWVEAYERWYTSNSPSKPSKWALRYLQKIVLNSFDIVMAWLFDYIAQRTRAKPSIISKPFWKPFWTHADWDKWNLSQDRDIVCALENYDMVPALGWNYLLESVQDKMNVMADAFLTCKVHSECVFNGPITITFGFKGSDLIVKIPDTETCTHICNELPNFPNSPYPGSEYKYFAYAHAHMTTEVGHRLYCEINSTELYSVSESLNEVSANCYPLVVEKYITDRQYANCKSSRCENLCCKPLLLRPPQQPHCEIVTSTLSLSDFKKTSSKTITKIYPEE